MKKITEFFYLLWLKIVVTWRNFREYLKVISRYYRNPLFRKVDTYLLRNYLLENPYWMSKEYLQSKGEGNLHSYGETPLTTMEKIATECGISTKDVVYELGSGRGRACFWLHCFKGCKVVGIEFIPNFVSIAQQVKLRYKISNVSFVFHDMLKADFSNATVIYFYGTSSDTSFIMKLIDKLKRLPPGTKIITVSYPLHSYTDASLFRLIKTFPARFTWGEANVYLQIRNK